MRSKKQSFTRWGWVLLLLSALGLAPAAPAQSYKVIYNFTGQADGANPLGGVTMDSAGNLYGTTFAGGRRGFGNLYRLVRSGSSWVFYLVYTFLGFTQTSIDGANPYARPVIGPDGFLYGTTRSGGNGDGCRELHGCGTVYKVQPKPGGGPLDPWQEIVLYQFGTYDGSDPYYGDVVFDTAGNLYGMTRNGGANLLGAVYELSPGSGGWTESVLYSFSGADGSTPLSGPSLDLAGNLYGTTSAGGTSNWGTVFQLKPSVASWMESVLHNFQGISDGSTPSSGISVDTAGNLYGATQAGGPGGGGTAFELLPAGGGVWSLSTLVGFKSAVFGGSYRTLAMDRAGNLYGTTAADGASQRGSVFKLSPVNGGWVETSLHDFTGGADGAAPYGNLAFDAYGNIYGTASMGGAYGNGVVFQITP